MPKKLTERQIAFFEDNGYLCPVDAFDASGFERYRRAFAAFEAHEGGRIAGDKRNKSHLFLAWLNELVRHPAILDAVEDLIGPDILAYHAQWFVKEPHTESFVSFHQDTAYWGLDDTTALSVWLAFEYSGPENGCMQVIPGTHRHLFEHADRRHENNMLWRGQTALGDLDLGKAADLVLAPGQFSIHHGRIVHGSHPNRSDGRRVGYSVRYIPTRVRRLGPRDSAMLVRGTDAYGHFDLEPEPRADFDPAAIRVHEEMTRRFMENYLAAPTEKQRRDTAA
jgi:hypothetical protein